MKSSFRISVFMASLLVAFAPLTAHAHPLLDQAQHQYEQADFSTSLETLVRVSNTEALNRDELVQLLRLRVMVFHALNLSEARDEALAQLCTLESSTEFGHEAPPSLRQVAHAACAQRHAPTVRVEVQRIGARATFNVSFANDASLAKQARIHWRAAATDSWHELTVTGTASVTVPSTARLQYYAEANAQGGAVLASSGSSVSPLESAPLVSETRIAAPLTSSRREDKGTSTWLYVGIGAGTVAVAAAVVVAVLATSGGSHQTNVTIGESLTSSGR